MKILIIDNYDSFTYNLVHMVEEITGTFPAVFRNDEISSNQVGEFDLIMLSPGPGIPDEAGILKEVIKTYAGVKPIFGVCLGLQAITEVFGGKIINLNDVYHGVATEMQVTDDSAVIFKDIPATFLAARYHSWAATDEGFPNELKVTARDEEGLIQAIEHVAYPISAVQFHPESILTDVGKQLVKNFINSAKLNAELNSASK